MLIPESMATHCVVNKSGEVEERGLSELHAIIEISLKYNKTWEELLALGYELKLVKKDEK